MALPLSKLVVSRNAPVLKCMKGRNIAFWTKKVPVFKTVSCNVTSRDFSTQRLKPIFSWPRMVAKEIRCEKLKKPCLSLQRSASCSTLSTKTPTENASVLQRSKSQVDLHVTRGCKKRPDQEYQEQMPMPMGPCNCPWPGGCPPPGFMQSGNPCAMGMGGCCAPPMPGSPGCMGNMGNMGNMQNMPNMQCPCCGAQAPGACTPFGACGACAVPPGMMSGNMGQGMPGMPGMPPGMQCTMPGCMAGGCPGMPQGGMPGGMQGMPGGMQGGMCGSWGPCGGPMCAQGVPCPFPCPCHSANEQQAENKSNKKDGQ